MTCICILAANLDDTDSDEDSQSEVGAGNFHPSSPEPSESPGGYSAPVRPDGKLLFSYCYCSEQNIN